MANPRILSGDLARILTASDAPVYLLDDERTIVYCNPACARLLNVRSEDLIGRSCSFHLPETVEEPQLAAALLCPPPAAFAGQEQSVLITRTEADGTLAYRRGHCWPLSDGEDESAPVLVVLERHDSPAPATGDLAASEPDWHEEIRRFRARMIGRYRPDSLLGHSPELVRARTQIALAAANRAHVLVTGPNGSGKSHAARAIHYAGREIGTFLPLDCAVLEINVIRSSLRAFWTRHAASREAGATLLLADFDRLAAEAQAELAELLNTGADRIRVVATSEKSLDALLAEGTMSPALACLLSTIVISMPALTARRDDIPLMAQAFLEQVNGDGGKQVAGFSAPALDRLAAYSWPGNLDELATVVREAHASATRPEIAERELPYRLDCHAQAQAHPKRVEERIDLEEVLGQVERELIERALRRAKGNKSQAARLLGLSRQRFLRRLAQLGLAETDEPSQE